MSSIASLLPADRDRRFSDWSETIVLRTLERTYDPQMQRTTETPSDLELSAIVGAEPHPPTPGTAGHHVAGRLVVLVKSEALTVPPAPGQRVVRNEEEYDVTSTTRSADGLVWAIACRLRA